MKKIEKILYQGISMMTSILFVLMVGLCILQVLSRYVFKISLSFTEELARYLFVWVTFLGTAMALKRNQHVKMELLLQRLPDAVQKAMNALAMVFTMIIYMVLMYSGIMVVSKTLTQTSPALNLPMGMVYAAVPVSVMIMIIFDVIKISSKKEGM